MAGLSDDLRHLIEYDILRAKRILRGIVAELPRSIEARLLLGDTHMRAQEIADAVVHYRAARALQPTSGLLQVRLALCALYLGDLTTALEGFERLHRAAPDEQSLVLAGVLLHRLGRPQDALERFRALREQAGPASEQLAFSLQAEVRTLRSLGQVAAADARAQDLLALLAAAPLEAANQLRRCSASFDHHEWFLLADKGRLAQLLARFADTTGGALRFPPSFVLPDDSAALAAHAARQEAGTVYIIKPREGQGGQSIRLTQDLELALAAAGAVVQPYLHPPYLVQGRKAHLRIYGLVTSAEPLRCYVYDDGIVRFAPRPYQQQEGWLDQADIHITNTALHRNNPLLQVSQDGAVENAGHIWSLKAYLRQLAADGHDPDQVFTAIGRLVGRFLLTLRAEGFFARQAESATSRGYGAKLFGLDVVLDAAARPWLIEAQRSPAWTSTPPLVGRINGGAAEAMTRMMSSPLLRPREDAAALGADLTRREQEVEGRWRGGFVRLVHDPAGEQDGARGGREILL
jgi:tubulin polyglutamylase TTLL6/13